MSREVAPGQIVQGFGGYQCKSQTFPDCEATPFTEVLVRCVVWLIGLKPSQAWEGLVWEMRSLTSSSNAEPESDANHLAEPAQRDADATPNQTPKQNIQVLAQSLSRGKMNTVNNI